MHLIRCHIDNFGKLQDISFEFDRTISRICEDNGWGKSTFAAFIRAMFYGLAGERKKNLEENERKRYRPWQGGVFGGFLIFEQADRIYKLTRIFGEKESQDEYELRDARTNLLTDDFGPSIGEELFGINRDSFMRTVLLSQNDCETTVTDDINARIGNLLDHGNDMNNFEEAVSRLTILINRLNPNRSTGLISRRKAEIAHVQERIRMGESLEKDLERYEEKLSVERTHYKAFKEEQERYHILQDRAIVLQKALSLKDEREKLENRLNIQTLKVRQKRNFFPGDIPEIEDLDLMIDNCIIRNEQLSKMSFFRFTAEEEKDFKAYAAVSTEPGARPEHRFHIFPPLAMIFIISGIIAGFAFSWIYGLPVCVFGLVLLCLTALTGDKQLWMLSSHRNKELATDYQNLIKKQDAYTKAEHVYHQINDILVSYLEEYGFAMEDDTMTQLLHIRDHTNDYLDARRLEEELQQELQKFEQSCSSELMTLQAEGADLPPLEHISDRLKTIAAAVEKCYNSMNEYKNILAKLRVQYDEWSMNKEQLSNLKNEQEEDIRTYNCLVKSRNYLIRARQNITSKYSDPIYERFKVYYEMISSESADSYFFDANVTVTKDELGKQREIRSLSTGYKDLIGICMRLALVDAMYKNEAPFLVFDDPFVNLDDSKMKAAHYFLGKISQRYQIIYLTCSKNRADNLTILTN